MLPPARLHLEMNKWHASMHDWTGTYKNRIETFVDMIFNAAISGKT